MSIAFWIKVLSGVPNHMEKEGILSTMETPSMEGWEIMLGNWNGVKVMKFRVNDFQFSGKHFWKEMDTVTFGTWMHYAAIYHLTDLSDSYAQFKIYKNGQLHNHMSASSPTKTITQNVVDELAIGRRTLTDTGPPYINAVFDEVLFFDGKLDGDMINKLYEHYQID